MNRTVSIGVNANSRFSREHQPSILSTVAVLIAAVVIAALSGCAVKLIGDYDDAFDKGVTEVEQKAELHFAKLKSSPNSPFDQDFYDDLSSRMAVLKSRAAALPKYGILTEQLNALQTQLDDFQKLDKTSPRPISSAIVSDAQSGISVSFESILKLELALKRTGTAPSAAQAPATKK